MTSIGNITLALLFKSVFNEPEKAVQLRKLSIMYVLGLIDENALYEVYMSLNRINEVKANVG